MRIAGLTFVASLALASLGWADAASACSCQKEYMIKKYGTVSAPQPAPSTDPAPSAEPVDGGKSG